MTYSKCIVLTLTLLYCLIGVSVSSNSCTAEQLCSLPTSYLLSTLSTSITSQCESMAECVSGIISLARPEGCDDGSTNSSLINNGDSVQTISVVINIDDDFVGKYVFALIPFLYFKNVSFSFVSIRQLTYTIFIIIFVQIFQNRRSDWARRYNKIGDRDSNYGFTRSRITKY